MKLKSISLFEIGILILSIVSFSIILSPVVKAEGTELGCCYDENEGLCTPNSLEEDCLENPKSSWLDDGKCEVPQCNRGCCKVGLDAQFVTERRCSFLSESLGVPSEWDDSVQEESACVESLEDDTRGACVIEDSSQEKNLCKFTTKAECMGLTNRESSFHKNYLCSNPELDTVCEKQSSVDCAKDKEEIYWFDSCGNKENIYSTNERASWNGGMVLKKEDSCNPNSNNFNSDSCGNCNYDLGSICGEFRKGTDKGNMEGFTCRNLNCKDALDNGRGTKNRVNGESWCVYDSQIGERNTFGGKISVDAVGSGHYAFTCNNGVVEVEPCGDYRKEICVENEKTLENGDKVNDAFCRVNTWEQCLSYNSQSGGGQGCSGTCLDYCNLNPDCRLHNVDIDSKFKFNICVPSYPPGSDLGINLPQQGDSRTQNLNEEFGEEYSDFQDIINMDAQRVSGNQICDMAELTCPVLWVKKIDGWECEENCDCLTDEFTKQMNNFCVSLGDCGAYTNWVGEMTYRGGHVTKKGSKGGTPSHPEELEFDYSQFAEAERGQYSEPGEYDEVESITNLPLGIIDPFGNNYNQMELGELPKPGILSPDNLGTTLGAGAVGGAVGAIGALGSAGYFGGIGLVGNLQTVGLGAVGGPTGLLGPIGIGVAIGVLVVTQFMGIGKTKIIEVTYHCDEWQLPYDYNDCEKCNEDPHIPCTSYRCESLGARCQMVNEGSDFGKCVDSGEEDTIPTITPWEEILNESFKYQDVSTNGFRIRTDEGECIQAFTPLIFGVETDIYAQCKISQEPSFEENWDWFLEGELFTKNHTYATYLPSVESLLWGEVNSLSEYEELYERVQNNEIDAETVEELGLGEEIEGYEGDTIYEFLLNKVGDLNYYVKCNNLFGRENDQDYKINFCVEPGPDKTLPFVSSINPENEATIKLDAEEQDVTMFANEPVDCKWANEKPTSTNMTEVFEEMENSFECNQDANTGNLIGFKCNATLPTPEEENDYYILCKDQPWLGESEERNYGGRAGSYFKYNLKKTENPLEITSIKPSGTITLGKEPVKVELKATTKGGFDEGNAECRYEFKNEIYADRFLTTNSDVHLHELDMESGEYGLIVKCEDILGNKAQNISEFKLELDTNAPKVSRVYKDGNELKVITTEDANCYYEINSLVDCDFNLGNASIMGGASSKIHTVEWNSENTYYITCKDIWGNKQDECSIIAKPEDII